MATYAQLTAHDKDVIKKGLEQMNQIMRQTHVYREALGRAIAMLAIVAPKLPTDRTGSDLVLDFPTDSSLSREKDMLVDAYNALKDVYAILHYDETITGGTHTRSSASNAELSTWLDAYFILD